MSWGLIVNRMKLTRLIWWSCNILVGMAIDELNFERGGEADGRGRYVPALVRSEVVDLSQRT